MNAFSDDLPAVLAAALHAVDPVEAVRRHMSVEGKALRIGNVEYRLADTDRIVVVGGGKAAAPMAAAVDQILGDRIAAGKVNVKYGHVGGSSGWRLRFGHLDAEADGGGWMEGGLSGQDAGASLPHKAAGSGRVALTEAGHPVPDAAGQAGAAQQLALVRGLGERDLVIVLISGGGSALLPLPSEGMSLADLQAVTGLLLRSGASIVEVNAVRKHCSQIAGGQLAHAASPARVASLILSDVVGTPLDVIASGPTVGDSSRFEDAVEILKRYGIWAETPAPVRARLEAGVQGTHEETPKPGDRLFDRVNNVVIGDNAMAGRAAVEEAWRRGWHAHLLTTFLQGEAREAGRFAAGLGLGVASGQSDWARPACLVLGGETTVTVRGDGVGGRNQELALAAAIALDEYRRSGLHAEPVTVASLATDGNDGPTAAAGGVATCETLGTGKASGLDARAALAANDSFTYLNALDSLIITGPTNTNVNDLVFTFVA